MFVPMTVSGLTLDPITEGPIVVLKETKGKRKLLIWIGLLEANAIATELEGIKLSRPMTHDLFKNIMELLDLKINKVEVCDLKDNTYYALIHVTYDGKQISVDARPSDALALSLRVNAPIFVAEEVIEKSKQEVSQGEAADKSKKGKYWKEILESLDPDDFGNS
jgi:bifunctional DNase/RNase